MNEQNTLQISHVLYQVGALHEAVKKLRDAGFIVSYGTDPEQAYNALIWFEQGVFIELFQAPRLPAIMKTLMKIFGYRPALDRMEKWRATGKGWCEWALESNATDLNSVKHFFKQEKLGFKGMRKRRKDIHGQVLSWQLLLPDDIHFPFIMSAYVPQPRPDTITHPNGITHINATVIGNNHLDTGLLDQLLTQQSGIEIVNGQTGLQTIRFAGSALKIESILGQEK